MEWEGKEEEREVECNRIVDGIIQQAKCIVGLICRWNKLS